MDEHTENALTVYFKEIVNGRTDGECQPLKSCRCGDVDRSQAGSRCAHSYNATLTPSSACPCNGLISPAIPKRDENISGYVKMIRSDHNTRSAAPTRSLDDL